jgi:hypothetical protein
MQNTIDRHDISSCFLQLTDDLAAGCDSDFDMASDDLQHEFQEFRLLVTASDGR